MPSEELVWVAADYHFPSTYSCRATMSSANNARALPTPGPGTVRLAMIKASVESFGVAKTKKLFFRIICEAKVLIRPPFQVAFSSQLTKGYKSSQKTATLTDSLIDREMSCANGLMTVFIQVPKSYSLYIGEILKMIGYWGTNDSMVYCVKVSNSAPLEAECLIPILSFLTEGYNHQDYFTAVIRDFKDGSKVNWEEITLLQPLNKQDPFENNVYVWPLRITKRYGSNLCLKREPFRRVG